MAKGYFKITENENDKNDFIIRPIKLNDGESFPQEQIDFTYAIEKTLDIITNLYTEKLKDERKFYIYFNQLKNIAKLGLEGENAQCAIANKGLDMFKEEILNNEAGKIKNNYIESLGKSAFKLGVIPLAIGIIIDFILCSKTTFLCTNCLFTKNLFILWSGTMLGVWISYITSRNTIAFEDLILVEKDFLEPYIRLLFVGGLSIIFALLLINKVFVIKLGELSSENILKDIITAFVIGAILGLNDRILGTTITKKVSGIF